VVEVVGVVVGVVAELAAASPVPEVSLVVADVAEELDVDPVEELPPRNVFKNCLTFDAPSWSPPWWSPW